jgi:serine/threonine protein kinase
VLLSHAVFNKLKGTAVGEESKRIQCLGRFEMPDSPSGSKLFELKVRGLEARFFGGVSPAPGDGDHSSSNTGSSGRTDGDSGGGQEGRELQTAVGEGMMFKEDNFLTSANLCRWVIDFNEVQLGRQVGLGSYGVVYRGKWKGVDVAVKRFIKQKLDERRMLEFRAEMAFLSELHHPNIVLFIGTTPQSSSSPSLPHLTHAHG